MAQMSQPFECERHIWCPICKQLIHLRYWEDEHHHNGHHPKKDLEEAQ